MVAVWERRGRGFRVFPNFLLIFLSLLEDTGTSNYSL